MSLGKVKRLGNLRVNEQGRALEVKWKGGDEGWRKDGKRAFKTKNTSFCTYIADEINS